MKFNDIIILDWYDNIIKALCQTNDDTFYCSLLTLDFDTDVKIYACISIKYLNNHEKLIEIINSGKTKENWENLIVLLSLINKKNKSYLVKTQDLKNGTLEVVKFKDNFNWNKVLLYDYPEVLEKSSKVENWSSYW